MAQDSKTTYKIVIEYQDIETWPTYIKSDGLDHAKKLFKMYSEGMRDAVISAAKSIKLVKIEELDIAVRE